MPEAESTIVNRRRHPRSRKVAHESLERALTSYRRLGAAWMSVLDVATSVGNWERLALAEAKLEECRTEIARLENTLGRERRS